MKVVVVSSHLDDAALSASAGIAGLGATVVTVFTGLPPADLTATTWDRLTGAASSRQRQQERITEDQAAMAVLGATGVHLGEPEALYRQGQADLTLAVERMAAIFATAREVWLPAAIGRHRDHVLARDAGLRAARAAGHGEVVLYADFPYVILYGWPSWVTGRPAEPFLDAAPWLAHELESAGFDLAALTPRVVRLSPAQRAVKSAVIGAYQSQAPALKLAPRDLAAASWKLDYEISWRAPLAT
jgi:LmbE family N-acetylglucosaminyl deacetylase